MLGRTPPMAGFNIGEAASAASGRAPSEGSTPGTTTPDGLDAVPSIPFMEPTIEGSTVVATVVGVVGGAVEIATPVPPFCTDDDI